MENIIEDQDKDALCRFITSSDRFTNGPKVAEFEEVWSQWLGVENSVMVNSGASANYLSIAIVKELFGGGEIIAPCLGWASDVSSIAQLGMTPVLVDVDPQTMGLNLKSLEKAFTDKTKAVVVIHALGFNALTSEIQHFLDSKGVFVIEDCCEAHGARYSVSGESRKVGTFGDLSLFSFYFGHHITTIEGGMICTSNPQLHELARMFRSHGLTREASREIIDEHKKKFPFLHEEFTFAVPGFNVRSTEINAALGLSQMRKLDRNIEIRRSNLSRWLGGLNDRLYKKDFQAEGNSSFALPLILNNKDENTLERVKEVLLSAEVEYRMGTAGGGNMAWQPFVKNNVHRAVDDQKTVAHIHHFGLYVGNGEHVTIDKIDAITERLNSVSVS